VTEFDKVIPPGGVGKVTASIDTSHYRGPIAKSIRVTTNPASDPISLELKADVIALIDVIPTDTPYVRTTAGEATSTELTLSATDGRPFDVMTMQADPTITVTIKPAPGSAKPRHAKKHVVASGSPRYVLTITSKPDLPTGQSIANATLGTDRAKAEKIPIRVVFAVMAGVQVVPPRLVLRAGPDAGALHATIRKPSGAALKILNVQSSDPEVTATTTAVAEGREYDLTVTYTGQPGRGPLDARVTLRTDAPGQGAIVIPVTGSL
jgi:hypothetical protein